MSATIILGVGAGIAAYKSAHILRALTAQGHTVHVIPTEASLEFVGATTWRSLSGNPVHTTVFDTGDADHIELARHADLILIAPATADVLARLRGGQANDLLTTTVLASQCPVVLAPAMHTAMWENPATVENVKTLRSRGFHVLEPAIGALGSGDFGKGRLPEPDDIANFALSVLNDSDLLHGTHIVVTAGGTREALDPVRFIGNISTGHQGCALAAEAAKAGANVTLIAASVEKSILPHHRSIDIIEVVSAQEMYETVMDAMKSRPDCLIMTAAVADFRPKVIASSKIKKSLDSADNVPQIELERTPDILATVGHHELRPQILIGFAAETGSREEILHFGSDKAARKGADLIAVNEVGHGKGFGDVPNTVALMNPHGTIEKELSGTKTHVARGLIEHLAQMLRKIER